ncbi:MAG: preprotein translocase subunit SecY [Thermotogota bacterium]|nr:preprotein translocase subunit SecY [Thermotogota bacterium]MDK2864144.1 preprotein translocase subunit SecY [Thermotogota bacterium]
MWQALRNAFKIPELRDRIIFTLLALIVFRLGIFIPVPGINLQEWANVFKSFSTGAAGGLVSFFDVFAGGALRQYSIFAMSVTPYINASIMLQLLASVMPKLKELLREGEEGRKKFAAYTRRLTVFLGGLQAFFVSFGISRNPNLVVVSPWSFVIISTATMLAGTMFLLWLGERITEKGIGNGISVLIFAGIVARYPQYFASAVVGNLSILGWIFLIGIFVVMVLGIIFVQQGERRIQIQYARRISGRRVYGGAGTYIPIRVNQGGVIPIIFAAAIMTIPGMIGRLTGSAVIMNLFSSNSPLYITLYGLLVFFFTYFYSAISFDPYDVADNIKKYGGFIPGIRPGRPTVDYLMRVLNRVTFLGAIFLVIIALLPSFVQSILLINIYIGGTSALIAVGVALDVLQQMEAHLIMRHYEGFIKKGRLRGRR